MDVRAKQRLSYLACSLNLNLHVFGFAHDQGYRSPETIREQAKVRGRGGTILQPGIDLLEKAEDFSANGPLLIITDEFCDCLRIRNPHSFLIPRGRHLPFIPQGQVFRIV